MRGLPEVCQIVFGRQEAKSKRVHDPAIFTLDRNEEWCDVNA